MAEALIYLGTKYYPKHFICGIFWNSYENTGRTKIQVDQMPWQDRWHGRETQCFHEGLFGAVAPESRRGAPVVTSLLRQRLVSFLDKTADPRSVGTAAHEVV